MENQEINVAELIAELNEKFKENTLTNKLYHTRATKSIGLSHQLSPCFFVAF